jgi:hypothetical protein
MNHPAKNLYSSSRRDTATSAAAATAPAGLAAASAAVGAAHAALLQQHLLHPQVFKPLACGFWRTCQEMMVLEILCNEFCKDM